eukprot:15331664-Alexandrium_andersonii.AAC.1
MSASLVGSEMCIRDSPRGALRAAVRADAKSADGTGRWARERRFSEGVWGCLLYTSDAADDM